MQRTSHSLLTLLTLGLLVVSCSSCSRKARMASHLEAANRNFAAGQYDLAEIEYKNALDANPANSEAYGRLGTIYLQQGRLLIGWSYLVEARKQGPENVEARSNLAVALLSINPQESRDEANFVLDRNPTDEQAPTILVETVRSTKELEETRQRLKKIPAPAVEGAPVVVALGSLDFLAGRLKEAEAAFKSALASNAKSANAHFALGTLYWKQNDLVQADAAFKQASALSPVRSVKRLQYAEFKKRTGDLAAAKGLLEEIVKEAPDSLTAWIKLAEIASNDKKYDEADVMLTKVIARDDTIPEAMLLGARVKLAKGETDKAIVILEKLTTRYPAYAKAQLDLGLAYGIKGDFNKAADSLNMSIKAAEAVPTKPGLPPPDISEATMALAQISIRKNDSVAAVVGLQRLIQQRPDLVPAKLMLAFAYGAQGNFDGALTIYRELEEKFPQDPQFPMSSGLVLAQQNKREDSRKAFEKALAIAPDNLTALEQLVYMDTAARQYPAALKRMETAIAKSPKEAGLYLLQARIFLAQKDDPQTEAALKKAIELQPDLTAAYVLLAKLYVDSNQQQKALANVQQVVAKNPKAVEAFVMMAMIYEAQKDYAAAQTTWEKVLEIDPKFTAALNNLAYLSTEHLNQQDKAYAYAQRARTLQPNDPSSADTLGWILYKRRQYPEALTLLQESTAKLPGEPEAQFHLGMVNYMAGNESAARDALEKALHLNKPFPGAEEAKQRLALLTTDAGKAGPEARTALEKRVAEQPGDPIALARLADVYQASGDLDKALKTYQLALQANPRNSPVLLNIARIYLARNDTAKALESAKAARSLSPGNPEISHVLGRVAYQTGDYTYAASLLQEAAQNQPDNPETLFDWAEAAYSIGKIPAAETAMRHALETNGSFSRAADARRFLELVPLSSDPAKAVAATAAVDQALKASPTSVPALMAMAAINEQKPDLNAAKQNYEKVLSRYPDFGPALRRLTILYSGNPADTQKGSAIAGKARLAYQNDMELARALGIIAYSRGDFSGAESLLRESAQERTTDAELLYYLGMAQHQLKDSSSKRSLQQALDLGLKTDQAAKARGILAATK